MKISQATIQAVQNSISIEEVISDFVALKRKGSTLWACCPFHHEQTPSFSVSSNKGFYKCFGCDAAGDAITFIKEIEGLSFLEAITYLAQKYSIPIQQDQNDQDINNKAQQEKDGLYILLNWAKDYYVDVLWKQSEGERIALSYLKERGIPVTFSKKFELGYSIDAWDGFYKFAQQKGYHDALLIQAGLLIQKNTKKVYDRFRGRLMFPIHNVAGKVIAFGARELFGNSNVPKYINSPETTVYHKGNILYGLFQAKQKIRQEDCTYLVEGYTDVIALHIAGIENVVASSGTALTENQIQLIGRYTKKITILFDGDTAGIKAVSRGLDLVLAKGLHVKVVRLPEGEDPDSYSRQLGTLAFQAYLKQNAQDFITFKVGLLMATEDFEDPVQQANAIQEIVQSITVIPNQVEQALFIRKCSSLLGVAEHVLLVAQRKLLGEQERARRQAIIQKRKHTSQSVSQPIGKGVVKMDQLVNSIEAYEREVIRILFNYSKQKITKNQLLYEYMLIELQDVTFYSPKYKLMMDYFQKELEGGIVVDIAHCIYLQDENVKNIAIDLIAVPHEISEIWEKKYSIYTNIEANNLHQAAFQTILRLKLRLIQQLIEENRKKLQKSITMEEEKKLLHIHVSLKESESAISAKLGTVITALNVQ